MPACAVSLDVQTTLAYRDVSFTPPPPVDEAATVWSLTSETSSSLRMATCTAFENNTDDCSCVLGGGERGATSSTST